MSERSTESAIGRLLGIFRQAEVQILRVLLGASTKETTTYQRGRRGLTEVRTILDHLRTLALSGNPQDDAGPAWDVVREAYKTGAEQHPGELTGVDRRAAQVLYGNLSGRIEDAIAYVGRRADDQFRQAQLDAVLQGTLQGSTRKETSVRLEQDLRDRGVKAFRDKRGTEWSLSNYVEMAARTVAREAHTVGTTTRLSQQGMDLVKVSAHRQDHADVCTPHENKVYSISGKDARHPPAAGNLPPYHPNCVHNAAPYIERFA